MKELHLLKERVQQAGRLLPWWANLIMGEVSFVTLYLMESGLLWMILVPNFFVAASIVASFEAERQEHEIRRREAQVERMPVTKIIVKDLLKEKYRESFIKAWKKPTPDLPENFSKTMLVSAAAIIMILSTAIVMRFGGKLFELFEKNKKLNIPQAVPEFVHFSPQPKTSLKGEKILSYRVSMQDGRDLDCKDVARTAEKMFLLKCERLSGAVHISRIKDMEIRTAIPNGTRVTVIQPENFPF